MTDQQVQAIATEVRDLIEQMIASGNDIEVPWLVNAVVGAWEPPGGRDADKWMTSGYANVRTIVRQVVQKYSPAERDIDPQISFPGYERLHRAYLIKRSGESKIVRTETLSVDEAMSVMSELMRCRTGLDIHINELQRFIDEVLIPRERAA